MSTATTAPSSITMDTTLLLTSLALTLLLIAVSTYFLFFWSGKASGNAIYLVGPSGSGKTALWTFVRHILNLVNKRSDMSSKLKYGRTVPTQTSMSINSCLLTHASLKKPVTIIDCPGHPRLAHLLRQSLATTPPRGVTVLLDAATIKQDLNSVANSVYSTLLALPRPIHVLFVANKSDLFTALPVHKVRELLEEEISTLKKTRDDGLEDDEERPTLGGPEFNFSELEEDAVMVEWTKGSIESREVAGVLEWVSDRIS